MIIPAATLNLISTEMLAEVLVFLGWREMPKLRKGQIRQFVSPDNNHSALLPSKEFSDYNRMIVDSIKEISAFEHKSIDTFINKLLNPSYDIMKWRIAGISTSKGRIPFFDMTDAIDKIQDMMAATCLDTLIPNRRFHNKMYTNEVKSILEAYSFGQTETGSYIINLLCPLGYYEYSIYDPQNELPLQRRINIKLLSSVDEIQRDIAEDNKSKFDEDVDKGHYSVNFLETLSGMYTQTKDVEMNITADWNIKVKNPDDIIINTVKLIPRYDDVVQEIAEKYRPKKEENTRKTYYGKICDVSAKPELEDREVVKIKIATIGDDDRKIIVMASLDYAKYNSDVHYAFQNGKNVKLSGIMEYKGNNRSIVNGSIEILKDDGDGGE
jgi:hypothetical protein